MNISDMKQISIAENRYFLLVADRATQLLFASPLAAKVSEPVAECLLKLSLTSGIPYFLGGDAAGRDFGSSQTCMPVDEGEPIILT